MKFICLLVFFYLHFSTSPYKLSYCPYHTIWEPPKSASNNMTKISHVVCSFFSPLLGEKIACIMEHFALAEFYCLIVAFFRSLWHVFIWKLKNYVLYLEQKLVIFVLMFATMKAHSWLTLEVLCSSNPNIVHWKTWPSVWNFTSYPLGVRIGNRGLVWCAYTSTTLGYYRSFHAILSDKYESIVGSSLAS